MIPFSEEIEAYSEDITHPESELLSKLNRETHQKALHPEMISGHLQGRLLSLLSKLVHPKRILEIGTYTGYSALCLAEGLQPDGLLHTIDINEELKALQRKYFDLSEYGSQIMQHTGSALDIIPKLEEQFDLVFIDADKANYINYYNLTFPKLNSGGIIISDNVLWYGKVVKPTQPGDKDTEILKEFNQMLRDDDRIDNILLPIRDGLMVSRKK